MSDLISRKTLLKDVKGMIMCGVKTRDRAIELIENQPTAYDMDKVLEQLKENKINCKNSGTIFNTDDFVKLNKVIEIVRGGGNDE